MPLTADRAKPAVPIGGRYRLIDFVLSNLVNSGILKIKVLTQYKSDSLNTHLARGWRLPQMLDFYVEPVPAQMRLGQQWFLGSADALHQSLNVVTDEEPDFGRNVLPALLDRVPVNVYDYAKNDVPGSSPGERGYWRDVGTIAAYYEANMDLIQVTPSFDLYNARWPVRTWSRPLPPAKF